MSPQHSRVTPRGCGSTVRDYAKKKKKPAKPRVIVALRVTVA